MKHISSIFVTLLLTLGLAACSVDEGGEIYSNDYSQAIRFLPAAPPAYGSSTRVATDGTTWSEGDVVFIRIVFYADEGMTNETSFLYTAMRFGSDGNWTAATGSMDGNSGADFTFNTVDAGANNTLWSTNDVILWPLNGVKKAMVQALYAGQHPDVELLNGGAARIRVNASGIGLSEILTSSRSLSQTDLAVPVRLAFSHRLTRLDFGKALEEEIQIISGSSGSGVNMIPLVVDFSGTITQIYNRANIPSGQRYVYIAPDEMVKNDAARIFRFQDPVSAAVVAAFSLPQKASASDFYGLSYTLASQNGGSVTPDDMLPVIIP